MNNKIQSGSIKKSEEEKEIKELEEKNLKN